MTNALLQKNVISVHLDIQSFSKVRNNYIAFHVLHYVEHVLKENLHFVYRAVLDFMYRAILVWLAQQIVLLVYQTDVLNAMKDIF